LGIVTVEAAMIALIELSHLLDQPAGESQSTDEEQAA